MPQSMNAQVTRPKDVLVRELGAESVLLNLATESYFGLDDVGTRMWNVVTTSPSIAEAAETLIAEYEIDPEQLRNDLSAFVTTLVEAGLADVRED